MIQKINRDMFSLSVKSREATESDFPVAKDLLDTLIANKNGCVGMAANMIGKSVSIIAFENLGSYMVMFNPKIIAKSGEYETEEGCLSLSGKRKTKRYMKIRVRFQDEGFNLKTMEFSGFTAQIIQHEIDHTKGIII